MKIDFNNEIINAGQIKSRNLNSPKRTGSSQPAGANSLQEFKNVSNKRVYIDAIVISQMAQNFFSNAILISSRLKKIANEAVLSGSINQEKLNEVLSGINSSLNELQEKQPAVSTALQEHVTLFDFTEMKIDFTETNNNLDSLNKTANELSTGRQPDLKTIDRINDNFFNNISKINNYVNSFSAEFSLSDIRNTDADAFKDLSSRTNRLVTDYPQAALKSQGNLNHEAVANLIKD